MIEMNRQRSYVLDHWVCHCLCVLLHLFDTLYTMKHTMAATGSDLKTNSCVNASSCSALTAEIQLNEIHELSATSG